jgi:NAD(P)-dependent dehydrogenase (short-subunit alcohol dehydrogenase family)
LTEEVAVVTGAARGIGRAVAERFADERVAVGVLDIDAAGAAAVVAGIYGRAGRALALHADVADSEAVARAMDEVAREFGPVTVLVNNAGVAGFTSMLGDDAEEIWHRVLAVNLTGAYLCARHAARQMLRAGRGAIINVASTRALMSEPDGEPYGASKGGMLALTHAMAVSLGGHGIRVNAVSPGWILTKGDPPAPADHAQHPAGRVGCPEDVAAACVFLADHSVSGFMTGQNLVLDGGMTIKMIYL